MKTATKISVCLFEGRHPLPENQGAICSGFNFNSFRTERTPLWERVISILRDTEGGNTVTMYVTGLTPALTEFLSEVARTCQYAYLNAYDAGNLQDTLQERPYCSGSFPNKLILMHYNNASKKYNPIKF